MVNDRLEWLREYGVDPDDLDVGQPGQEVVGYQRGGDHGERGEEAQDEDQVQDLRPALAQVEPKGDEEAQVAEVAFPGLEDAVEVNRHALEAHGQDNHALLSEDSLAGALGRAENHVAYTGDVLNAAAALAHGVGQAQSFEDGNKRTAYHLTRAFLDENGLGHVSPVDFDDEELADHLVGYGEGTHSMEDTAEMFKRRQSEHVGGKTAASEFEDYEQCDGCGGKGCEDCRGSGLIGKNCEDCKGSGLVDGNNTCWGCSGTGMKTAGKGGTIPSEYAECIGCHGTGCDICKGSGIANVCEECGHAMGSLEQCLGEYGQSVDCDCEAWKKTSKKDGYMACELCGGKGQLDEPYVGLTNGRSDKTCPDCMGAGIRREPCAGCGKTETNHVDGDCPAGSFNPWTNPRTSKTAGDRDYTHCDFCDGEGEVRSCQECLDNCKGTGKCSCTYCDEDGPYVACYWCKGSGIVEERNRFDKLGPRKADVKYPDREWGACPPCKGTGIHPNDPEKKCYACKGAGIQLIPEPCTACYHTRLNHNVSKSICYVCQRNSEQCTGYVKQSSKTRMIMPARCPSCDSSETRGRYHRGGWREYVCLACGSEFKNRDSKVSHVGEDGEVAHHNIDFEQWNWETDPKAQVSLEALLGIVGAEAGQSPDEIRGAYRQTIKQNHPDVLGDDGDRAKTIISAYEELKRRGVVMASDKTSNWGDPNEQHQISGYGPCFLCDGGKDDDTAECRACKGSGVAPLCDVCNGPLMKATGWLEWTHADVNDLDEHPDVDDDEEDDDTPVAIEKNHYAALGDPCPDCPGTGLLNGAICDTCGGAGVKREPAPGMNYGPCWDCKGAATRQLRPGDMSFQPGQGETGSCQTCKGTGLLRSCDQCGKSVKPLGDGRWMHNWYEDEQACGARYLTGSKTAELLRSEVADDGTVHEVHGPETFACTACGGKGCNWCKQTGLMTSPGGDRWIHQGPVGDGWNYQDYESIDGKVVLKNGEQYEECYHCRGEGKVTPMEHADVNNPRHNDKAGTCSRCKGSGILEPRVKGKKGAADNQVRGIKLRECWQCSDGKEPELDIPCLSCKGSKLVSVCEDCGKEAIGVRGSRVHLWEKDGQLCNAKTASKGPKVTFVQGDITKQDTDAIVNAANEAMLGGGGVDGAIHDAAGPSVLEECKRLRATTHPNGLKAGEAAVTGAGDLPSKHIIHAVGPRYDDHPDPAKALHDVHVNSLARADEVGARSVSFPAISTGIFGYPLDEAAKVAVNAVRTTPTNVEEVRFVSFDDKTHAAFSAHDKQPWYRKKAQKAFLPDEPVDLDLCTTCKGEGCGDCKGSGIGAKGTYPEYFQMGLGDKFDHVVNKHPQIGEWLHGIQDAKGGEDDLILNDENVTLRDKWRNRGQEKPDVTFQDIHRMHDLDHQKGSFEDGHTHKVAQRKHASYDACFHCDGTGLRLSGDPCMLCSGTGLYQDDCQHPGCGMALDDHKGMDHLYQRPRIGHVGDDDAAHHSGADKLREEHPYWDTCRDCGGDGIEVGSTDVATGEQKQKPCGTCSGLGEEHDMEYWDTDDQLHDFGNYPNFREMSIPDKELKKHLKDTHEQEEYDDTYSYHQTIHGVNVDPAIAEVLINGKQSSREESCLGCKGTGIATNKIDPSALNQCGVCGGSGKKINKQKKAAGGGEHFSPDHQDDDDKDWCNTCDAVTKWVQGDTWESCLSCDGKGCYACKGSGIQDKGMSCGCCGRYWGYDGGRCRMSKKSAKDWGFTNDFEVCGHCEGTGSCTSDGPHNWSRARPGAKNCQPGEKCGGCDGSGLMRYWSRAVEEKQAAAGDCRWCKGNGIMTACKSCGGLVGRVRGKAWIHGSRDTGCQKLEYSDDGKGEIEYRECNLCEGTGEQKWAKVSHEDVLDHVHDPENDEPEYFLPESEKALEPSKTCLSCAGSGTEIDGTRCTDCNGFGTYRYSGKLPEDSNAYMLRHHIRTDHDLDEQEIGIEPTGKPDELKKLHDKLEKKGAKEFDEDSDDAQEFMRAYQTGDIEVAKDESTDTATAACTKCDWKGEWSGDDAHDPNKLWGVVAEHTRSHLKQSKVAHTPCTECFLGNHFACSKDEACGCYCHNTPVPAPQHVDHGERAASQNDKAKDYNEEGLVRCDNCQGTGEDPDIEAEDDEPCAICNGTGLEKFGSLVYKPCPVCGGSSIDKGDPRGSSCDFCKGTGMELGHEMTHECSECGSDLYQDEDGTFKDNSDGMYDYNGNFVETDGTTCSSGYDMTDKHVPDEKGPDGNDDKRHASAGDTTYPFAETQTPNIRPQPRGKDPWVDQGDTGNPEHNPGLYYDPKLKKWLNSEMYGMSAEVNYPGNGLMSQSAVELDEGEKIGRCDGCGLVSVPVTGEDEYEKCKDCGGEGCSTCKDSGIISPSTWKYCRNCAHGAPAQQQIAQCGTCGYEWDQYVEPTPSGRCPNEYEHDYSKMAAYKSPYDSEYMYATDDESHKALATGRDANCSCGWKSKDVHDVDDNLQECTNCGGMGSPSPTDIDPPRCGRCKGSGIETLVGQHFGPSDYQEAAAEHIRSAVPKTQSRKDLEDHFADYHHHQVAGDWNDETRTMGPGYPEKGRAFAEYFINEGVLNKMHEGLHVRDKCKTCKGSGDCTDDLRLKNGEQYEEDTINRLKDHVLCGGGKVCHECNGDGRIGTAAGHEHEGIKTSALTGEAACSACAGAGMYYDCRKCLIVGGPHESGEMDHEKEWLPCWSCRQTGVTTPRTNKEASYAACPFCSIGGHPDDGDQYHGGNGEWSPVDVESHLYKDHGLPSYADPPWGQRDYFKWNELHRMGHGHAPAKGRCPACKGSGIADDPFGRIERGQQVDSVLKEAQTWTQSDSGESMPRPGPNGGGNKRRPYDPWPNEGDDGSEVIAPPSGEDIRKWKTIKTFPGDKPFANHPTNQAPTDVNMRQVVGQVMGRDCCNTWNDQPHDRACLGDPDQKDVAATNEGFETCRVCEGKGSYLDYMGKDTENCEYCKGSGIVGPHSPFAEKTGRRMSYKNYECMSCGKEQKVQTNHYGEIFGQNCNSCSWKGMPKPGGDGYDGPGGRRFKFKGDGGYISCPECDGGQNATERYPGGCFDCKGSGLLRTGAVREKNVRCPQCQEKHDPSDRCAEVKQTQLPLWEKGAGTDDTWEACEDCEGQGCSVCKGSGIVTDDGGVPGRDCCNSWDDQPHTPNCGRDQKKAGFEWVNEFKVAAANTCNICGQDMGEEEDVCPFCLNGATDEDQLAGYHEATVKRAFDSDEIDPAYKYPKGPYDCKNCDKKVWDEPTAKCSISGRGPGAQHLHKVIPDDVMNEMRSIMQQGHSQPQQGPQYRGHQPMRMRVEGKDYEPHGMCQGSGCGECKQSGLVRSTTITNPEHGTIQLGKTAQGERVLAHLELRPPQGAGRSQTTDHKPVTEDMLDFSLTGTVLPRGWRQGWDIAGGGAMGGTFNKQVATPAPGIDRSLIKKIDGLEQYHLNGMTSHCDHQDWSWKCSNCGTDNDPYPNRAKVGGSIKASQVLRVCRWCEGKGTHPDCENCSGIGEDIPGKDCGACSGSGDNPREDDQCPYCRGSGIETFSKQAAASHEVCPECKGTGTWVELDECPQCGRDEFEDERGALDCPCGWQAPLCNTCKGSGIQKQALFDYDPVRDVTPSTKSAPAPSAQGQGGDPWYDEGDNGIGTPRPGYIFDPKLKKWLQQEQLTYPSKGPMFPGVSDVNKIGAGNYRFHVRPKPGVEVPDKYESCDFCAGSGCEACRSTGLAFNEEGHTKGLHNDLKTPVEPHGIWDRQDKKWVDSYGKPSEDYWASTKGTAQMRARELNERVRNDMKIGAEDKRTFPLTHCGECGGTGWEYDISSKEKMDAGAKKNCRDCKGSGLAELWGDAYCNDCGYQWAEDDFPGIEYCRSCESRNIEDAPKGKTAKVAHGQEGFIACFHCEDGRGKIDANFGSGNIRTINCKECSGTGLVADTPYAHAITHLKDKGYPLSEGDYSAGRHVDIPYEGTDENPETGIQLGHSDYGWFARIYRSDPGGDGDRDSYHDGRDEVPGHQATCEVCKGAGVVGQPLSPGGDAKECNGCEGSGKVHTLENYKDFDPHALVKFVDKMQEKYKDELGGTVGQYKAKVAGISTCPSCKGKGESDSVRNAPGTPCYYCKGSGLTEREGQYSCLNCSMYFTHQREDTWDKCPGCGESLDDFAIKQSGLPMDIIMSDHNEQKHDAWFHKECPYCDENRYNRRKAGMGPVERKGYEETCSFCNGKGYHGDAYECGNCGETTQYDEDSGDMKRISNVVPIDSIDQPLPPRRPKKNLVDRIKDKADDLTDKVVWAYDPRDEEIDLPLDKESHAKKQAFDACRYCEGSGEVGGPGTSFSRHPCSDCSGSGVMSDAKINEVNECYDCSHLGSDHEGGVNKCEVEGCDCVYWKNGFAPKTAQLQDAYDACPECSGEGCWNCNQTGIAEQCRKGCGHNDKGSHDSTGDCSGTDPNTGFPCKCKQWVVEWDDDEDWSKTSQVLPQPVGDHQADNGIEDPVTDTKKTKIKKIIPGTQKTVPDSGKWNVSIDNMPKTGKDWGACPSCEGAGCSECRKSGVVPFEPSKERCYDGVCGTGDNWPNCSTDCVCSCHDFDHRVSQVIQTEDAKMGDSPEEEPAPKPTTIQLHVLKSHPEIDQAALLDPELEAIHLESHFEGFNTHNPETLVVA